MAVTGLANLAVKRAVAGLRLADLPAETLHHDLTVDEGFLHPALFTDNLEAQLEGHSVVWGPEVVEGAFGKRRIAFVDAPGGIRLEFMEQLAPPPDIPPTDARR